MKQHYSTLQNLILLCLFLIFFGIRENVLNAQISLVQEETSLKEQFFTEKGERARLAEMRTDLETWDEVTLTLFEGATFSLKRSAIRNYGKSLVWTGEIIGSVMGYTIIARTNGVLFGKVYDDQGRVFLIKPSSQQGLYTILESKIDKNENCLTEAEEEDKNLSYTEKSFVGVCDEASICEATQVNLLIVYNQVAKEELGGTDGAVSAIAMAVAEMNQINENSGVIHTFELAHTDEVWYPERFSTSEARTHLSTNFDPYMNSVFNLRDEYEADLVCVILGEEGEGNGTSMINRDPVNFDPDLAFNATRQDAMLNTFTLAHECGHNLGIHHDRFATPGSSVACSWMFGYVNQNAQNTGHTGHRWYTVMAYGTQCTEDWGFRCDRVPYWSNPDILFSPGEHPMGIERGMPGQSHVSYAINRSMCLVADFRGAPVTSVEEEQLEEFTNKVSIYPNPVREELVINLELDKQQHFNVKFTNLLGQEIALKKKVYNNETINISVFSKGVYYLQIFQNGLPLSKAISFVKI